MLHLVVMLLLLTGTAHSYLGERYLLGRLFKRDNLPKLFGSTAFTIGTLRFAWHLTTVAWWCLAYLVLLCDQDSLTRSHVMRAIGTCAVVSGIFPLYFTRGRHLSWIVFFLVGGLLFLSAAGR